jgi:hypothetical protein
MRAHSRAVFRVVVTLGIGVLLTAGFSSVPAADGFTVGSVANSDARCTPDPLRVTCYALIQPVPTRPSTVRSSGPYSPMDLRNAYRVPASDTTATVAVIEAFGAASAESDLAVYRKYFGLPPCTVTNGCLRIMDQDGGPALPESSNSPGWDDETVLDLEMVSAICPSCHLLLVQSRTDYLTDMLSAVDQAGAQGAKYISMSWGTPEQTDGPHLTAVPGVAYVAASGDAGYGTAYPAADPNVVSVGGTTLYRDTSARGWSDSVWHNDSGGTGGGCSSDESQPAWQRVIPGLSLSCANRSMNDLSIDADPNTGVYVYDQGQWVEGGGTSAGAPMIAAMFAIAGQPSTDMPASAVPYQHPEAFADVTQGANGSCGQALCKAGVGYDTPSGLGVPQGVGGFVAGAAPNTILLSKPKGLTSYVGRWATVKLKARNSVSARMTFFATGLPNGLTLAPNGTVTGKPTSSGSHIVRLTVVDNRGSRARTSFVWTVATLHRLVVLRKPVVSGTLVPGSVARANWGAMHRDSASGKAVHPKIAVQWFVNGRPVKGATKRTFRIPASFAGKHLSVRVTAVAPAYIAYQQTSPKLRVQ